MAYIKDLLFRLKKEIGCRQEENKGTTTINFAALIVMPPSYTTVTETHIPVMDHASVQHLKETCSILLYIKKDTLIHGSSKEPFLRGKKPGYKKGTSNP